MYPCMMPWKRMLACVTGQIEDSMRQKLEFVLEENRVYRALLDRHSPNWRLDDTERKSLAKKGKVLGKLLEDVITIVKPGTLLRWYRRLVAKKWDFSRRRTGTVGRPPVDSELEKLVIQIAKENLSWGAIRQSKTLPQTPRIPFIEANSQKHSKPPAPSPTTKAVTEFSASTRMPECAATQMICREVADHAAAALARRGSRPGTLGGWPAFDLLPRSELGQSSTVHHISTTTAAIASTGVPPQLQPDHTILPTFLMQSGSSHRNSLLK